MSALDRILAAARDGDRLELLGGEKPRRLWPGLGNRAGLHSFAGELLREKWTKSGDRLRARLEKLPAGSRVRVLQFRNVNRDRGRWVAVSEEVLP